MKQARLHRLFNPRTRRCFDVAVDHGFFNEPTFLAGIEDMPAVVRLLAAARPDAIQLTAGQAHHLQGLAAERKPALVLRTDVANVYGRELPRLLYSRIIEDAALQAVRLDAACMVVNLFRIPDQPELADQCVQNILRLKPQADHYGLPLMVEPLVFRPNAQAGGYMVDGDPEKIIPLVRQAVELGADIIKADPTDDVAQYHRVVAVAGGIPVLVRGGGRASEREILARTAGLLAQGAAGIVFGRNIIQHPRPAGITRALMAVVHDGATVEAALALIGAAA
jgi:DhnA family fructose-bisphosphate aldolase class Ia